MKKEHSDYFNEMCGRVLKAVNTNVKISVLDLETSDYLSAKDRRKCIAGICRKKDGGTFEIFIDEYYVEEFYKAEVEGNVVAQIMNGNANLIYTICHEIAHTKKGCWNHGKKHRELTAEYVRMVNEAA